MRQSLLRLVIGAGIVVAGGLAFWFVPKVREARMPTLVRAMVGVEVDGDGVGRVGLVEAEAGSDYRLHAIVEAAPGRSGDAERLVYYSATPQVLVEGRLVEALPVDELDVLGSVRLLWFSVEYGVPFESLEDGARLDDFDYEPFFRPEWGSSWSIDGTLDASFDGLLDQDGPDLVRDFGTLRYQVWVEVSRDEDAIVPDLRLTSAALPDATRLVARLPGILGPPSAVFGLPAIVPGEGSWNEAERARLARLYDERLAFSQVSLLREMLERGGVGWDDLNWDLIPLDGSTPWQRHAEGSPAAGDLVRVADRWVVLYRDDDGDGSPGMLDGADLCFDFDAGAAVRRLDQIFVVGSDGEGDVLVASTEPPG